MMENPFAKHVQDGWRFNFEHGFVGASHPQGGKFTVCEMKVSDIHGENQAVGEAIAEFLNSHDDLVEMCDSLKKHGRCNA